MIQYRGANFGSLFCGFSMKILMKAVAGSHLFGLNTEKSDMDYKGIFIPTAEEILLQKVPKTYSTTTGNEGSKNSKDDIDIDLYSLNQFFKMLEEGQTVALELLFTPDEMIIEKDPLWDEIVKYRSQLVSKKVTAFIGYARQQAAKYGIKGSRMGDLKTVLDRLPKLELVDTSSKMQDIWGVCENLAEELEFVHIINKKGYVYFEVCGKKFDKHNPINHSLKTLHKIYDNYGDRTKLAQENKGVDWKAVSHALRVCHQGIELLRTGKITLPITKRTAQFIKEVKMGRLDFVKQVQPFIETWLKELEDTKVFSKLPEKIDKKLINKIILEIYSAECYSFGGNLDREIT